MSSLTFVNSPSFLYTSESVTEGHPDKICDQISDAILDAMLAQDPDARVACETATTTGLVLVMGEISTRAPVSQEAIANVVRQTIREIGYTDAASGLDSESCGVLLSLHGQSADIAAGVDREGAGDQGMMIGFACDETPELMPLTISLAHRLTRRLAEVRKSAELPWLRPDGKSQVTVEYAWGKPRRIEAIVLSAQHAEHVEQEYLHQQLTDVVIRRVIPGHMLDADTKIHINPTGRFVTGGPHGDAGLTGRKIIVDTYGGVARHGGGAFSGKDGTKVDRSAAYMARYAAKNIVAAGLASRFELQVSYAIGRAEPTSLAVETFGTGRLPDGKLVALIKDHFDMRPASIIRELNLRQPQYRQVASYGHFGRDDLDVPWERCDRVAALRSAAGLAAEPAG